MGEIAKQQPTVLRMISAKASKFELIQAFGKLTTQQVITGQYPTLGQLIRGGHKEQATKAMAIVLLDLSASFNNELTEDDAREIIAETTHGILVNLTLEDVYIACRQIKMKPSFGKLNINKLLTHFNEYFDNRGKLAGKLSYNAHLATKFTDDRLKDVKQEVKDKFREAQVAVMLEKQKEANT